MGMAEKLKSRKFWLTLLTSVLVLFGEKLGLDVDPDTVKWLVGLVASYVLGQGYVDGQAAKPLALNVNATATPAPSATPTEVPVEIDDDKTPILQ